MWLGISRGSHGYDAIDTDDQVTVRSEVARLTRLYDKAVKTNTLNDPDMYSTGAPGDPYSAAMRNKVAASAPIPAPAPVTQPTEEASSVSKPPDPEPAAVVSAAKETVSEDPTSSAQEASKEPATPSDPAKTDPSGEASSKPEAKPEEQPKKLEVVPQASQAAHDPDESPASAANPSS